MRVTGEEQSWNDADDESLAQETGLTFQRDDAPGYYRRRRGSGWSYHLPDGKLVRDGAERERVQALAIPPAWTEVWISRDPSGHLQATGRDSQGRKQYRYHPRWEDVREGRKFKRLLAFGLALPGIRREVDRYLNQTGLSRDRVLAACVTILDRTGVRIGYEEYARQNHTFGLATVRDRHTEVKGATVSFEFEGKGGREARIELCDRRIAAIVRECRKTPGYEVFKWVDDTGSKRDVEAEDVNQFIRQVSGGDFSAKDFRTWLGTVQAFEYLCGCDSPEHEDAARADCVGAADVVAERLGNTREVARSSYIHAEVLKAYVRVDSRTHFRGGEGGGPLRNEEASQWLSEGECGLLTLLEALASRNRAAEAK